MSLNKHTLSSFRKHTLSSFRRMPESIALLKPLDPGLRRDDGIRGYHAFMVCRDDGIRGYHAFMVRRDDGIRGYHAFMEGH